MRHNGADQGCGDKGSSKLRADHDLKATLSPFEERDWVVFPQSPRQNDRRPEHVVKYLARSMTGGPISDRRLSHLEWEQVHSWARAADNSGRQVLEKPPAIEFVRHWSLHIFRKGFTKTRFYGGWSNI